MIKLRPYQEQIKADVYRAWDSGFKNVLLVMPTGMGKTKTFCSIVLDDLKIPTAIKVHRKELVQQISLVLAEEGIYHNLIASRKDIKGMIAAHRRMFGRHFYNVNANVSVISVDTLNSRVEVYREWAKKIRRKITDEAAHVLKDNKWGKADSLFINAHGLGVTATPERLDRKGLGSHVDGIYDVMVEGPTTRYGIENGYLSRYKIVCPPGDYEQVLNANDKGADTSDYSKAAMLAASRKSHIVGDVVQTYLRFTKGKQAIYFADSIETSERMEKEFIANGVQAKSLDGTTADNERLESLIAFREKKIQVLINVDLFDEGLDVPGIEVVGMARPTKSLGKYLQMVGRGLRVMPGKEFMFLIDHVGNVKHHGLPDNIRRWTLDRTSKRKEKLNFIRICSNPMCNAPYDRALTTCPWCGTDAIIASRDGGGGRPSLEQVDGDLTLIDPEQIREMEAKTQLPNPADIQKKVGNAVNAAAGLKAMKDQQVRIATQEKLKHAVAKWAGVMKHSYRYSDRQIHKKFFLHHRKSISEALAEPREAMEWTISQLENVSEYY